METKHFADLVRFDPARHVHVPVYVGKRTKVLLLCLSAGQQVPPHSHPGFEITLQPLRGKAQLPMADGSVVILEPGMFISVPDGDFPFNPVNPFEDNFEMLIHLVQTK